MKKLKLHGFNNLTKILSFNMYEFCFAMSPDDKQQFISYVNKKYSASRLTEIISSVTKIIGAQILNIAKQDYEPQGASVNILIAEKKMPYNSIDCSCNKGDLESTIGHILGHLDKSHISVHTYPEIHPSTDMMTFRADIDVTTCGQISPLKALNFLIEAFSSDIIFCDYLIRGFTRDINGKKHFRDHLMKSIQDFISKKNQARYNSTDVNISMENMFHTKMIVKELNLDNYLLQTDTAKLDSKKKEDILQTLQQEMQGIFSPMS